MLKSQKELESILSDSTSSISQKVFLISRYLEEENDIFSTPNYWEVDIEKFTFNQYLFYKCFLWVNYMDHEGHDIKDLIDEFKLIYLIINKEENYQTDKLSLIDLKKVLISFSTFLSSLNNDVPLFVETIIESNQENIFDFLTTIDELNKLFDQITITGNSFSIGEELTFKIEIAESQIVEDKVKIKAIFPKSYFEYEYLKYKSDVPIVVKYFFVSNNENKTKIMMSGTQFRTLQEKEHTKEAWRHLLTQVSKAKLD